MHLRRSRKPGPQIFPGGSVSVITTTLENTFASWLLVVDCVVARPEVRRTACEPICVTLPLKIFPGIASMVTSASCPIRTFTMSVSSTFTSAVTTRHIRQRHQKAAVRVLNARHHVIADTLRQIAHDAVGIGDVYVVLCRISSWCTNTALVLAQLRARLLPVRLSTSLRAPSPNRPPQTAHRTSSYAGQNPVSGSVRL